MYSLTLDIGGTNPRIAIVDSSKNTHYIEHLNPTKDLISQINDYLSRVAKHGITTNTCIIAAAGIIKNNSCLKLTNSDFIVDSEEIKEKTLLSRILVLNDFQAIAYATKHKELKTVVVQEGKNASESVEKKSAIIGPGTGLGVSLEFGGKIYSSESGHIHPPQLYPEFLSWLERNTYNSHLSAEDILSGRGISHIFEWKTGIKTSPEKISHSKDPLAKTSMTIFISYLGAFLQQIALMSLCNTIYLGGGILPKNKHLLSQKQFIYNYSLHKKEHLKQQLENVRIVLIDDYNCSFIGCKIAEEELLQ